MKLSLKMPTILPSAEYFTISLSEVGDIQVRTSMIKSSMIGKTVCGRLVRLDATNSAMMGCEWRLNDIISIEKTPSAIVEQSPVINSISTSIPLSRPTSTAKIAQVYLSSRLKHFHSF